MFKARSFVACAAGLVLATALMSTAANASTCTAGGSSAVTVNVTGATCSPSTESINPGSGNFGVGGDQVVFNNPSYSYLSGTTFAFPATSGSFAFLSPSSSYISFILAFQGVDTNPINGGIGWGDFVLTPDLLSSLFTGTFAVSGTAYLTNYAFYGETTSSVKPTPLPAAFYLFATVLLGAWGIRKWQLRSGFRTMSPV